MGERIVRWADNSDDFEAVAALIQEYSESFGELVCFEGMTKEVADLRSFYPAELGGVIVCVDKQQVVGCCALLGEMNENGEKVNVEFRRNYVIPTYRKKGVAKEMLQFALQAAADLGFPRIWLETHMEMKAAIELYKSMGFTVIEEFIHEGSTYFRMEKVW